MGHLDDFFVEAFKHYIVLGNAVAQQLIQITELFLFSRKLLLQPLNLWRGVGSGDAGLNGAEAG